MSGIAGTTSSDVERVLREYAPKKSRKLEPVSAGDDDSLVIVDSPQGNVTVLYPGDFLDWDEASAFLSSELNRPVFSLHVHDGDLWMYVFFVDGEESGRFNPLPEYWDDSISVEERESWAGDASILCLHWPGIAEEDIKNYLIHWDLDQLSEGLQTKAYPEDEYPIGQDWQICDFMKKISLIYPIDEKGAKLGKSYQFTE